MRIPKEILDDVVWVSGLSGEDSEFKAVPLVAVREYFDKLGTPVVTEEQYVTKKEFDAMAEVVKLHIKRIDKLESPPVR